MAKKINNNNNISLDELQIVEIIWVDAEELGDVGWNDRKEMLEKASEPCPVMHTIGYEIYRDKKHISIVSTIGTDLCGTLEKIPTAFVRSITYK
jgi:hypothetical protein